MSKFAYVILCSLLVLNVFPSDVFKDKQELYDKQHFCLFCDKSVEDIDTVELSGKIVASDIDFSQVLKIQKKSSACLRVRARSYFKDIPGMRFPSKILLHRVVAKLADGHVVLSADVDAEYDTDEQVVDCGSMVSAFYGVNILFKRGEFDYAPASLGCIIKDGTPESGLKVLVSKGFAGRIVTC